MIPADHWHDNGDGTAWLVDPVNPDVSDVYALKDRPCDTCYEPDFRVSSGYDDANDRQCPDCDGTGRHTFTVEVECDGLGVCWHSLPTHVIPHRVSVVPGMVLAVENVEDVSSLPPAAEPGMWAVKVNIHD